MRTTLSLDDDVAALLEKLRKERDGSFKVLVNEALRRGLLELSRPEKRPPEPYRTPSVSLGGCLLGDDLDDVAGVLAIAEGEDHA